MGFGEGFRKLAVRIFACCDEEVHPAPRIKIVRQMSTSPNTTVILIGSVQGLPFGFQHVGGAEMLANPHEKSTHGDTGIEAFLENRRLAINTTTIQNTIRHQANKLSASIRCSVYSNNDPASKHESKEILVTDEEQRPYSGESEVDDTSFDDSYVETMPACEVEDAHDDVLVEDGEIVVAHVMSMKRYGSTDLLNDSSVHEEK